MSGGKLLFLTSYSPGIVQLNESSPMENCMLCQEKDLFAQDYSINVECPVDINYSI